VGEDLERGKIIIDRDRAGSTARAHPAAGVQASAGPSRPSNRDSSNNQEKEPVRRPVLSLSRVYKDFAGKTVVNDVSFTVGEGEFVSLLGPSGSGKTTILRMIAGLEPASQGEIYLESERIDDRPPYERHVTTVFQDYALFPHMSVFDNVAFGLRCQQRFSEAEIADRVRRGLELVRLGGYEGRSVRNLSGGERQRVALSRAVVTEPALLLLDEPLGALDLKLRRQTGRELQDLQRRLGLAFLYVTHDQEEALSMSDRVILMHRGQTEQIGTPLQLFWRPRTRFVAEFIGEANIISGSVLRFEGTRVRLDLGGGLVCSAENSTGDHSIRNIQFALRGEEIILGPEAVSCINHYDASVAEVRFYGSLVELTLALRNGLRIRARQQVASPIATLKPPDDVAVGWHARSVVILAE
jgi:spermidine/putrescine transport system ATP-binding protein